VSTFAILKAGEHSTDPMRVMANGQLIQMARDLARVLWTRQWTVHERTQQIGLSMQLGIQQMMTMRMARLGEIGMGMPGVRAPLA
jgi:hypothetical protein